MREKIVENRSVEMEKKQAQMEKILKDFPIEPGSLIPILLRKSSVIFHRKWWKEFPNS
jgi:hypothetical protein